MTASIAFGMPLVESMSSRFFESWVGTGPDDGLRIPPGTPRKIVIGGMIPAAYDLIARWFLEETDADYLLTLEQDHRYPSNLFERVANYTEPVVGSHYFTRNPPPRTVVAVPHPDDWKEHVWGGDWSRVRATPLWPSLEREWRTEGGLNRVLWVGLGCTAIRRDVLEAFPKDRPYFVDDWDPDQARHRSCDVRFCWQAARMGFATYVDMGLVLPHMTVTEVTHETYWADMRRKARQLGMAV